MRCEARYRDVTPCRYEAGHVGPHGFDHTVSAAPQPATASEPSAEPYGVVEALDDLDAVRIRISNTDGGTARTWQAELGNLAEATAWLAHARAPLTVSEEVRVRAAIVVFETFVRMNWENMATWEDKTDALAAVDAVLAVLRSGRSEVDK